MAYEPTVWADGDVITKAKLNNIEGGIEALDTDKITAIELTMSGSTPTAMKITHSSGEVVTAPITIAQ